MQEPIMGEIVVIFIFNVDILTLLCLHCSQAIEWQWSCQTRTLRGASWALAPPNSLRYQNIKQPALSHPLHHAIQPQRGVNHLEVDWEVSLSVCVLVRQGELNSLHTLLEIPLSGNDKLRELLALGPQKSPEFSFSLTMVDGSREDDVSVESFKRNNNDTVKREHGSFRSLFEAERCPAPYMQGSHFYCFHCPSTEPGCGLHSRNGIGLENKLLDLRLLPSTSLCNYTEMVKGNHTEGDNEREEKLAVMYERLRIEVRSTLSEFPICCGGDTTASTNTRTYTHTHTHTHTITHTDT